MGKNELCRTNVGDAVLAALKHNHEKCAWHCRFCLLVPDDLHAIRLSRASGVWQP
jgi:putative transposase